MKTKIPLIIKYHPATNFLGSRLSITCRGNRRYFPFDGYANVASAAEAILIQAGFVVSFLLEMKDHYIIAIDPDQSEKLYHFFMIDTRKPKH